MLTELQQLSVFAHLHFKMDGLSLFLFVYLLLGPISSDTICHYLDTCVSFLFGHADASRTFKDILETVGVIWVGGCRMHSVVTLVTCIEKIMSRLSESRVLGFF